MDKKLKEKITERFDEILVNIINYFCNENTIEIKNKLIYIPSMEKEYLTQEKFNQLQIELQDLRTTKRKEVAEHLEHARSLGDLSENAEYHEAREEQAQTEARILQIEGIMKNISEEEAVQANEILDKLRG